ncbi:maltose alpha-D-glucosyltransferase [Agaricicola taiwanensis]|uniref:Maltose alpha-D-glucosyltransferase n=1 Tax=Agaricicola taiwanensis TaxID=591372 RepID=A0A8J2VKP7_9RHOB|nr:alpha-amylase family protein [Agaricicola taiwanensis]GGE28630.1 maltose alpha-D-glucosyltransferase [Agaricicola taiwanensis]
MWYQDAIIYGIDVEKFADGNGDGIGDFIGLTSKLPYLRKLGITCIWLLPFFDTPNRDNGYDIRDYYRLNPQTGTMGDFIEFIRRAGEHGIRVIVDLVVNHTSTEHPWFEAARRDARSRFRDYYIWSDSPPAIDTNNTTIFPGEEDNVWTYDEVANAYYFHRFYHFQPELNIANEEVREEVAKIMQYWMAFGVAGFRIDAAPIMIGENGLRRSEPRDPHGVLHDMNAVLRERLPDGLMMGEANVEPEKLSEFFGDGQGLGLLLNFYLNAFFFLALAREDAAPVAQALTELPQTPQDCGWGNFLRSLDELDLSRLTGEERQETYARFAPDESMRLYGRGIRRRIAPMLDGDQRRMEMVHSLILSLPGTAVMMYGDEIGLGEDLEVRGRDAVRVPMQWSGGRNGGFSDAPVKKMIQAPVQNGRFGYKSVNVDAQENDPASLLNKVRALVALRRQHELIHRAQLEAMETGHSAVLGHRCSDQGGGLLFLHNFSGRSARVDIGTALGRAGQVKDLVNGEIYPIDGSRLKLQLRPYQYIWGQLEKVG